MVNNTINIFSRLAVLFILFYKTDLILLLFILYNEENENLENKHVISQLQLIF